jgi:hypothetical protein
VQSFRDPVLPPASAGGAEQIKEPAQCNFDLDRCVTNREVLQAALEYISDKSSDATCWTDENLNYPDKT